MVGSVGMKRRFPGVIDRPLITSHCLDSKPSRDAYRLTVRRFSLSPFHYDLSRIPSSTTAFRRLMSHDAYSTWKQNNESSILYLHGTNGVGKTTISQGVALALTRADEGSVIVYFSFGDLDTPRRTTASFLKALVSKVLSTISATWDSISGHSQWINESPQLTVNELWVIVRCLFSLHRLTSVWCVLDGIHECSDELLPHVETLFKMADASDVHFKTIATGESASLSMTSWNQLTINLDLPAWKQDDIDSSIASTMREALRQNHGLAELEQNIVDKLKHSNSPAEVKITLKALFLCARPLTALSASKNLPILEMPFPDLCARLLGPLEDLDPWLRTAMSFMCLSFRLLTLHELAIAINISSETKEREEIAHSLPLDLGGDLTRALGVLIDICNETAILLHQSVIDQFKSQIEKGTLSGHDGILDRGEIARRCLAYLRLFDLMSDCETKGYKTFLHQHDLDFRTYAAMYWPLHYAACQDKAC